MKACQQVSLNPYTYLPSCSFFSQHEVNICHCHLKEDTVHVLHIWTVWGYGNIGCGVSSAEIQKQIDFCLNLKIFKGNLDLFEMELMPSRQKLAYFLEIIISFKVPCLKRHITEIKQFWFQNVSMASKWQNSLLTVQISIFFQVLPLLHFKKYISKSFNPIKPKTYQFYLQSLAQNLSNLSITELKTPRPILPQCGGGGKFPYC